MNIDRIVFDAIHGLSGSTGIVDSLLIFTAKEAIIVAIILGILVTLASRPSWRVRAYYTSIAILSTIISRGIIAPIISFFFYRPRPFIDMGFEPLIDHAATGSFPSGHVSFVIPLALTYWMLTSSKKLGILAIIGAILMGTARIAAGVHWPLDIIGGIFVGTAGFIIARLLIDRHFPTIAHSSKSSKPRKKKPSAKPSLID